MSCPGLAVVLPVSLQVDAPVSGKTGKLGPVRGVGHGWPGGWPGRVGKLGATPLQCSSGTGSVGSGELPNPGVLVQAVLGAGAGAQSGKPSVGVGVLADAGRLRNPEVAATVWPVIPVEKIWLYLALVKSRTPKTA